MALKACLLHMLVMASTIMSCTMGDSAEEKQKCAEQLAGCATCAPYVGGDAKAPTPDCCSAMKLAIQNNKKCLCLIIKDRDDPDLGLKINMTLALGLPSLCKAPDNFSQCPTLLHLDPKSAEAKAFDQMYHNSTHDGSSGSPFPSPNTTDEQNLSTRTSQGTAATTSLSKNNACCNGKGLFKILVVAAGLLILL